MDVDCDQKPISDSKLNDQLLDIVSSIKVPEKFLQWAEKWSKYLEEKGDDSESKQINAIENEISDYELKTEKLLDKLMDDLITDDQYKKKKREYDSKVLGLRQKLEEVGTGNDREKTLDQVRFAVKAKRRFKNGSSKQKRRVIDDLGLNYSLRDKKVAIQLKKTYFIFSKSSKWSEMSKERFEPNKYARVWAKQPDLKPPNPSWLALVECFGIYYMSRVN